MAKEIIWGIIGCGDVTELKSGPAFNKIEGSKLLAVMRRDAAKAKDYAKRHQVPIWTNQADELINNKDINAIYIATPPGTHADYALKAMRAGKPVYVEKPMAASYAQCIEMDKVSKETNQPLFVAYYRRTLPGFLKLKELIEKGEIGKIVYTNIRLIRPALDKEKNSDTFWRLQPEQSGGGIFFDLASHQLDFLDFLFGPVKTIHGIAANRAGYYKVEDTVSASFEFGNGIVGNGLWSFVCSNDANEDILEIVGTEGKLSISCFNVTPVKLFKQGKITEFTYTNPENIQYNLIKQVVETLQGLNTCVSMAESAARTNWAMEEAVKAYYNL